MARARALRRDAALDHPARPRARSVLPHRDDVLEAGHSLAPASHPAPSRPARAVRDRGDDRQLGAGRGARTRAASAVQLLRASGEPSGRHLGNGRSAARGRRNVGAGIHYLRPRRLRLCPPLADAAGARERAGSAAGERALGGFMPRIAVPIAAHLLTGSVLTLVIPLGALIAVAIWYVVLWRRGTGER